MRQDIRNKNLLLGPKKQQGATLFTTLVFMVLMTVVGVSASKVSIQDMLMAGNEQQRMLLFQKSEYRLNQFSKTNRLSQAMSTGVGFTPNVPGTNQFKFDNSLLQSQGIVEIINDMGQKFECERAGIATSIGSGATTECDLYDFQINSRDSHARDRHFRGAGKMVPKSGSKGSIL